MAEGRLVVRALLESSDYRTRSLLVTDQARAGLADALERHVELPVYACSLDSLRGISGFNIHRGCLAVGERRAPPPLDALLALAPPGAPLVVLEGVGNADNVGAIFRNAAAFGASAVVLGPGCCDPLYRKALRVSIGAVLRVPWTTTSEWPRALEEIKAWGYVLAALTTASGATAIGEADLGQPAPGESGAVRPRGVALLLGNEGAGLSAEAKRMADRHVRIPMMPGVDSLNVAIACGIALHETMRGNAAP
jgi:tRNA G18 (ribose-2'-O)-methylase SpoU